MKSKEDQSRKCYPKKEKRKVVKSGEKIWYISTQTQKKKKRGSHRNRKLTS